MIKSSSFDVSRMFLCNAILFFVVSNACNSPTSSSSSIGAGKCCMIHVKHSFIGGLFDYLIFTGEVGSGGGG